MTSEKSKNIGGKQLFKGAIIGFIIFELVLFYFQTRGDFANGILSFIEMQANIIFFLLFALYFAIVFLLGRQAGYEILSKQKLYYSVALRYGIINTFIFISLIALIMILFRSHDFNYSNDEIAAKTIRICGILIIPTLLIWLWCAKKIKAKELKLQ